MSRHKQRKRRLPKGFGWFVFAALLGAYYFYRPGAFWGVVGVLACPLMVIIAFKSAVNKACRQSSHNNGRRKDWHPSGMSDKEWYELNDPRGHGEDY